MRINRRTNSTLTTDLGLGTKTGAGRSINKDGSFNVKRIGLPRFRPYEYYDRLILMPWGKFLLMIISFYVLLNFIFAGIYVLIGVEHLMGITAQNPADRFLEAFFFSSQTLTTLGYGRISPVGTLASTVAAFESMLGLLGFAMATGLLYGRFSKPKANVLFSTHAIVAPYRDNQRGLMFRMTNKRSNQLIEVEVDVTLALVEPGASGRSFYPLNLERKKINLFPLSWTLVHPLDESSPLFGMSEQEMIDQQLELFILVKAFDDSFSQTVYCRTSYRAEEIIWGAKFVPMFSLQADGSTNIDMRLIDAVEHVPLPDLIAVPELTGADEDPTV
ncbi:MAG: ion channel [Bacteroidia bacterium]|jgi:inward rectifier potassium channel|nr:ion channel [Bacteroidia bacterium]